MQKGKQALKKTMTIIFFAAFIVTGFANEQRTYRETTGDTVKTFGVSIRKHNDGGFVISYEKDTEAVVNREFSTLVWKYEKPAQGTDVTVRRAGNVLVLAGKLKGNPIEKKFPINNQPWFQTLDVSLEHFFGSGGTYVKFWIFRPDDMTVHEMEATKVGEKPVTANGKSYASYHVRVNLTGFAAHFWQAHYWFRTSDGVHIRYESVHGGPGTPLTVIELLSTTKP